MSYPGHLARKYIVNQKRHSVFTVLSITAAVLFITVIFTLFSSFWDTMLNVNRMADPWHAFIRISDSKSLETIKNDEYIIEHEIVDGMVSGKHEIIGIRVKFRNDVWEPTEHIQTILKSTTIFPKINQELLNYEVIGVKARANLVFVFSVVYCFVLIVILCSRMIIDTAFEISSKERESQFGILASVGASKKQIVRIIMWEGIFLSVIGIPLGILCGIGAGRIIFELVLDSEVLFNYLGSRAAGAVFTVSPVYILIVAATGILWVMLSAYGTGMRFAKKPPVEVIRHSGEKIVKVKKSRILGKLFGISGKLASRNIRRNKKRFIVTVVSITMSFLVTVFSVSLMNMCQTMYEELYTSPVMRFKMDYGYNYCNFDENDSAEVDIHDGEKILYDSGLFGIVSAELGIVAGAPLKDLPLTDDFKAMQSEEQLNNCHYTLIVNFVNEEYYNHIFDNNPPVPYKELVENNGFIYEDYLTVGCPFVINSDITFTGTIYNDDDGSVIEEIKMSGKLMGYVENEDGNYASGYVGNIYGTEEHYIKMFGDKGRSFYYNAVLKQDSGLSISQADKLVYEFNDKLAKAEENDGDNIVMNMFNSYIEQLVEASRFLDAIKIFGTALIVLISFIALVNVVNIISTSILNRRRENASLKSIGMSARQLNGMLLTECALYIIIAALITLIVSEGFVLISNLATNSSMPDETNMTDLMPYSLPLITTLISSVPVFVTGIITTFITQSGIKNNAISSELKNMD